MRVPGHPHEHERVRRELAIAAPIWPYSGMSAKFSPILSAAAAPVTIRLNRVWRTRPTRSRRPRSRRIRSRRPKSDDTRALVELRGRQEAHDPRRPAGPRSSASDREMKDTVGQARVRALGFPIVLDRVGESPARRVGRQSAGRRSPTRPARRSGRCPPPPGPRSGQEEAVDEVDPPERNRGRQEGDFPKCSILMNSSQLELEPSCLPRR